MFLLALLAGAVQIGFCRGDKVIPQVVDGPNWKTKFDITNISSRTRISNMRVSFFKSDGTPWNLQTNLFAGTDYILDLAPRETRRLETLGQGSQVNAGYVVIYDEESRNSEYSADFVLGISVFYEYSTAFGIADTVTVSCRNRPRQPTHPCKWTQARVSIRDWQLSIWPAPPIQLR